MRAPKALARPVLPLAATAALLLGVVITSPREAHATHPVNRPDVPKIVLSGPPGGNEQPVFSDVDVGLSVADKRVIICWLDHGGSAPSLYDQPFLTANGRGPGAYLIER